MKVIYPRGNRRLANIAFLTILILGSLWYGSNRLRLLLNDLEATKSNLASTQQIAQELQDNLLNVESENADLGAKLRIEQEKNGSLSEENENISTKVDKLTKLTTIDPELLKKYSKVFFLNENYVPADLDNIPTKYIVAGQKQLQFYGKSLPFLEKLLDAAAKDNIPLQLASAYRSFGTQSSLKASYTFTYGAGTANQFSADQGYSEHQLGTTVDFTTPTIKGAYPAFEKASAYPWLQNNAYKYGFILSYPKNNTYYEYEPWHWRFVGVELATWLHDENKNFYDVDQRTIDKYLIKLFD